MPIYGDMVLAWDGEPECLHFVPLFDMMDEIVISSLRMFDKLYLLDLPH
jgi:hypothetical protein